ncbi:putative methyltransferase-domain-containing protein [Gymnopilus junonius]|uniref:Methyltransferase-domain-containing protein n=1 Tax=Gymnopilus junonius TaxID=109634 RepID=A0A9P5P162_GYMJU|nr:putative methyltransferase-domain-containing protein [Gymnopilus junonius]
MDGQLFALLRQFYALNPTNIILFPKDCLPQGINDFLVNDVLLSQHFQKYPPSPQYQKRFWKWSNNDFEIDSRIYDYYLGLDSTPERQQSFSGFNLQAPPSQSYITHFWSTDGPLSRTQVDFPSNQSTTLMESRTTIESGTTGLRTWLASFVLSQYLIFHPELISSKRILELGSGIGFLGIIVASLQQLNKTSQQSSSTGSLWLTDVNVEVLSRCRDNVQLTCNLSSLHQNINYLKLDWTESIDVEESSGLATFIHEKINPDLILGADIVFDPSLVPSLVGTLRIALQQVNPKNEPKVALIALTIRNETTMNKFLSSVRGRC